MNDGGPIMGKVVFSGRGNCANSDAVVQFYMSLRDWFAGMALSGEASTWTETDSGGYADAIAERCYKLADAMLAERERNRGEAK